MILAASRGGYDFGNDIKSGGPVQHLLYILVGLVILVGFILVARFVAHFVGEQLRKREVRSDMVVLGRRAVTVLLILLGLAVALSFAVQSANITLFGLLLATVIAALGVQDLLKDYVSGYYVLLEHHFRVGERISFDSNTGIVTEIRLRVTLLKSDEGDVIVVPNSELFTKPLRIHGVTPEQEAKKAPPA
jgi:small-conductance mechanosensitive channel